MSILSPRRIHLQRYMSSNNLNYLIAILSRRCSTFVLCSGLAWKGVLRRPECGQMGPALGHREMLCKKASEVFGCGRLIGPKLIRSFCSLEGLCNVLEQRVWIVLLSVQTAYDFSHWFLFSLGYNVFGYYWIPNFLTEFGEISGFLNFFTSIIFSLILLPQIFIFIALFKINSFKSCIGIGIG